MPLWTTQQKQTHKIFPIPSVQDMICWGYCHHQLAGLLCALPAPQDPLSSALLPSLHCTSWLPSQPPLQLVLPQRLCHSNQRFCMPSAQNFQLRERGKGEGQQNKNKVLQTRFIQNQKRVGTYLGLGVPLPCWDKACEGSSAGLWAGRRVQLHGAVGTPFLWEVEIVKQKRTSKEVPKKFLSLFPFPAMLSVLLEDCRAGSLTCLRNNPVSSAQDKCAWRMSLHGAVIFLPSVTSHRESLYLIRLWLSKSSLFLEGSCKGMYQRRQCLSKRMSGGTQGSTHNLYLLLISQGKRGPKCPSGNIVVEGSPLLSLVFSGPWACHIIHREPHLAPGCQIVCRHSLLGMPGHQRLHKAQIKLTLALSSIGGWLGLRRSTATAGEEVLRNLLLLG